MALTEPTFTYASSPTVCFDVDFLTTTIRIPLNDVQTAEMTDDDLNTLMTNFRLALTALLPASQNSVGARIEWDSSDSVTITPPVN